jgi:Fe-S oxidoreductase
VHVLIVDDNSPDGTGALANALAQRERGRVHVLHRTHKAGLGTAYIQGFLWALARDYEYVFEMDADFSHDPAHLKDYGHVLAGDPLWRDRAKAFAARVRDLSEVVKPAPRRARRAIRVVYQDACHLAHGQRIRAQPRALLRAIEGVVLIDIEDAERCCGSAGIYNLTHPEISRELQQDKVRKILDAAPDVIVSANPGCMLQIAAGLRAAGSNARVVHLARFLDDPDLVAAGDP